MCDIKSEPGDIQLIEMEILPEGMPIKPIITPW